jgi:hypothetical protein
MLALALAMTNDNIPSFLWFLLVLLAYILMICDLKNHIRQHCDACCYSWLIGHAIQDIVVLSHD